VVARWRAESPSFDQALRGAMRTSRFQQGARRLWSEELQAEIVGRIIEGGSLRSIAADRAMPSARTLYNWVAKKPDFAAAVARACKHREDWYRDNMFEIAKAATEATLASDLKRLSQFRRQAARLRHRPGRKGK
jgi:transposase-like protein